MFGNPALDATKCHTHSEEAQDALDANLISLVSGCKAGTPDALYIFADAPVHPGNRYLLTILVEIAAFLRLNPDFQFFCHQLSK